jgi:ELWxxDGT repeat protein
VLYAFATTGGINTSLLRLDPATGQATTVKAFGPITNGSGSNQNFYGFRVVGAHFYFFGIEGDSHRQYWRSDGTEAGTVMISNFQPSAVNGGPNPSNANMIAFDGHFVFAANSEEVGVELFATEGVVGISETNTSTSTINAWVDGSGTLLVRGSEQLGAVRLLDATGREVARKNNVRSEQVQLPLTGLSAGLYLVRSEYKGKVGLVKVLLER